VPSLATAVSDDLDREVYCLQGFPVDAISMQEAVPRLLAAMRPKSTYMISTPNLNFLTLSQSNAEFRESLWQSDLCPPDGMPLIGIARLLGIPLKERVAGSDIFEALVARKIPSEPIRVFLFGGADGIAAAAAEALNKAPGSVECVGWLNPGFGSLEDMSHPHIIDEINASEADFLLVALGAAKGQAWLKINHHKIRIPVRSHLGATMAFLAGTVKRAPPVVRKLGLEWLWRIKEEPYLWKRYAKDAVTLSALLMTRVLPLALIGLLVRRRRTATGQEPRILVTLAAQGAKVSVHGHICADNVPALKATFRRTISCANHLDIDLSSLASIDARSVGLMMMVRKQMLGKRGSVLLSGASTRIRLLFWLHGASDLLRLTTCREHFYPEDRVNLDLPIHVQA
jgi:N-acetylglucosaminyldiphosphoundecaprenol N-acetyl-beta-D-mannosaminyltransferase